VIHLGERECSTQRSNQKLIEEAPAPCVSAEQRAQIGQRLCDALAQMGYTGAGTVEFLREPGGELFFMEMNTRLQVEHPVTELVTGVDLVQWQIRLAAGQRLELTQEDITWEGWSMECRINAEDPAQGFRPSPGTLSVFEAPEEWRYSAQGPVRLDSHVRPGYKIPTFYDSMIAKLIVHGASRVEAIERLKEALEAFKVEGVPTTAPLHRALLEDEGFASGDYNTASMAEATRRWMDQEQA
jgi:acetyl-CoA carboxylase biotin carboxylase subunit